MHSGGDVFMLMIEPTPYILGFVAEVRSLCPVRIDLMFAGWNVSQRWDEAASGHPVLPAQRLEALRVLWGRLTRARYRLVHLAGWSHPLVLAALAICWIRGIPITIESDTPASGSGRSWRAMAKRLVYPLLFRLPKLFLPGGTRQAAYLESYGVGADRIRIAQMTVDVEALRAFRAAVSDERRDALRNAMGLKKGDVVFLFVGRLEPQKGLQTLLGAFAALRPRTRNDCALLIVGDGACRREVEVAALRTPGIVAVGRLAGIELLEAYASADVFVLPSTREPWGLVVNEAMASRLPVIVTDAVGCSDDLVVPGVSGLVIPSGDEAALAEAMQALYAQGAVRSAFGAAADDHIRTWTLRNEANRVVDAWREAWLP